MDELPRAIQNQIWEYVRGHRAYWKQQFTQTIIKVIPHINQNLRNAVRGCHQAGLEVKIGRMVVSLWEHPTVRWRVLVYDKNWTSIPFEKINLEFEDAVKLFYEKVEYEAISEKSARSQ